MNLEPRQLKMVDSLFEKITRPKPKKPYYAGLLAVVASNDIIIAAHGPEYYSVVEQTHDSNEKGLPFLFVDLFNYSQGKELWEWIRRQFGEDKYKEVHAKLSNYLDPIARTVTLLQDSKKKRSTE